MKRSAWLEKVLNMWPVKVLSIAAAVLLFFFTRLLDLGPRIISAPIRYLLAPGYVISEQYPSRATVKLSGDLDKIFEISENDLQVIADFSTHETEGSFQAALRVVKLGAVADINPLQIEPEPGTVTVSIERSASREVPVNAHLSGTPKIGTELVSYSVNPEKVRIGGPRSIIPNIESVDTEEIDLSSHDSDFNQKVRLKTSDSLVRVTNADTVDLSVSIREALRSNTFQDVPLNIVGLGTGFSIDQNSLPKGNLKLQGLAGQLSSVDRGQLRMIVDASQINGAGKYTLKVIPESPDNLIVLSYDPKTVELVVNEGGLGPSTGSSLPSPQSRSQQ